MKIMDVVKVWMAYKRAKKLVKETKMEEGKSKWKSKTLWFNALTGLVGIATTLQTSAFATDPKVQAGFVLFLTIGNGLLRFLTEEPLKK